MIMEKNVGLQELRKQVWITRLSRRMIVSLSSYKLYDEYKINSECQSRLPM